MILKIYAISIMLRIVNVYKWEVGIKWRCMILRKVQKMKKS